MTTRLEHHARRLAAPIACLAVFATATGCSHDGAAVTSPAAEASTPMSEAERQAQASQVAETLQDLVDAYNARDAVALRSVMHGKYRFEPSPADRGDLTTMMRHEVLSSAAAMFDSPEVSSVSMSMEMGTPVPVPDAGRTMSVTANVTLDVVVPDVFGPPIHYLVDAQPAEFQLVPRGQGWAIVHHFDLYDPSVSRVVDRTWGQILAEFMP